MCISNNCSMKVTGL
ncbi:hypothetical protein HZS_5486 [Henneguya salminicola]|nr:hypothetical protein HZS_5486 [Henneguya salminicola]